MRFDTKFNCGDKAWVFGEIGPWFVTVGQIRIQYTKSEGVNDGYVEPNCSIAFDNFKPKDEEYEEVYMCVETGIGSGTLWRLGQNIFATEEECAVANAENIARMALAEAERKAEQRRRVLQEEGYHRRQLAEIERLKASA